MQSPLKKICQSAVASSTTACNAVADANCQVMACVPAEESTVSSKIGHITANIYKLLIFKNITDNESTYRFSFS